MPLSDSRLLHVAIIMDGNGRWASSRGWPRVAGHRAGVDSVRRVLEAAPHCGIGTLTVYAFSSDNWKRPKSEVDALMAMLRRYLREETQKCVDNGVRVEFIGRRDRIPSLLRSEMDAAELATREESRLRFRVALDYSSRDALLGAAQRARNFSRVEFLDLLNGPDVDLLIRTGGEQRLSDFLLWECAYAELYFTQVMWPDFGAAELHAAVHEFHARQRRFGALSAAAV